MLKRTWVLIALVYLTVAELLSLVPVPDLSLCLVEPEHSQKSSDHDNQKYCPAFHVGAALALEKVDSFLEHHDKSVVGGFSIVLAISTIGLWLATNKLWAAGERQFELLGQSAAAQSRDMQDSIGVARRAADAAFKQAETSENELRIARRPWVGLSGPIHTTLSFDGDGASVEISLPIKNGGLSPARGTFAALAMLVGPIPFRGDQSAVDAEMVRKKLATEFGLPIYPLRSKSGATASVRPFCSPASFSPSPHKDLKFRPANSCGGPQGQSRSGFP